MGFFFTFDKGYKIPEYMNDSFQILIWFFFCRNYVHRAFASVPETCKDQMEAVLKQKLTAAFARSESWSVDWEKEPLPVLVFVFVFYYNECGIPD